MNHGVRFFFILFIILMFLSGCVSSDKYNAVRDDYRDEITKCENKLENKVKANQIEKQSLIEQIQELQQALKESNAEIKNKKAEKKALTAQIEKLKKELQQKEKIISVHATAIRLFDDSGHTLQNSIQKQLADMEKND